MAMMIYILLLYLMCVDNQDGRKIPNWYKNTRRLFTESISNSDMSYAYAVILSNKIINLQSYRNKMIVYLWFLYHIKITTIHCVKCKTSARLKDIKYFKRENNTAKIQAKCVNVVQIKHISFQWME